jgi:periplasmic protein TonB
MTTPRTPLFVALALAGVFAASSAHAQFAAAPAPHKAAAPVSAADTPAAYKKDAAKHLYTAYAKHIHKGKMPPLLYGIAIIETEIDANGRVQDVRVVRQPAAAEVSPWAVEMIKQAGPFPAPAKVAAGGTVTYKDIWLVAKNGRFQLDTLTEGQR